MPSPLRRAEDPLRLLEHDGDGRHGGVAVAVGEEHLRPLVEHAPGEKAGDQQLLDRADTAGVDEHDLALGEVAQHGSGHRHVGVIGDGVERADPPGAALQDLQGVQRDTPAEVDVAEADEVVELRERAQPREALVTVGGVEALQFEQRLFLGPRRVARRGAEVVDAQLAQAYLQRRRARGAGRSSRCASVARPTGGG